MYKIVSKSSAAAKPSAHAEEWPSPHTARPRVSLRPSALDRRPPAARRQEQGALLASSAKKSGRQVRPQSWNTPSSKSSRRTLAAWPFIGGRTTEGPGQSTSGGRSPPSCRRALLPTPPRASRFPRSLWQCHCSPPAKPLHPRRIKSLRSRPGRGTPLSNAL